MSQKDAAFQGAIPFVYESHLVPMFFTPFATDLAQRAAKLTPQRILEIAAGTGAVTRILAERMPDAKITATDLNQAMLDVAQNITGADAVNYLQADACALPFADESFDVVLCQFGAMFFPDKVKAYGEARRVLAPAGAFIFNVWDKLEANDFARIITEAMAELYLADPPTFLARIPHGYNDPRLIKQDLTNAGFSDISLETIDRRSISASALDAARGLCEGTPLRSEIEARQPPTLEEATQHAAEVFTGRLGRREIAGHMQAIVVTARR